MPNEEEFKTNRENTPESCRDLFNTFISWASIWIAFCSLYEAIFAVEESEKGLWFVLFWILIPTFHTTRHAGLPGD